VPGGIEGQFAVIARQALPVGFQKVATLGFRDEPGEFIPQFRLDHPHPVQPPVDFLPAQQPYASEHQALASFGVSLRVMQRNGAAVGTAEHVPAFDTQLRAQLFDVFDGGVHRVVGQVANGL
jgi:hypothetical protein